MRARLVIGAGVAAALVALPGAAPARKRHHPPVHVLITGREYSLTQSQLKVNPGRGIIQFHNSGGDVHALTAQHGTVTLTTPDVPPGGTATLKPNLKKGTHWTFYCPLANHRQLGMESRLGVYRHRKG